MLLSVIETKFAKLKATFWILRLAVYATDRFGYLGLAVRLYTGTYLA